MEAPELLDRKVDLRGWLYDLRQRTSAPDFWRSPLVWIVAVVFVLHAIGIAWGLPASDGWDDDGIAPRDFLVGTAYSFWPGHFFTYPPVHLVLLTLLTLPVSLFAVLRARSVAPHDLIAEFIRVPYMTTFALTARLLTLLMSIGIVLALAGLANEVRGRTASYWVAAACGASAVFTYYGHTTNLDVPYLFWGCLALLFFARAIVRQKPRLLRSALVLAALAVGTKDQAYALFVLSIPLTMALWLTLGDVVNKRAVLLELAKGAAIAAAVLLFVDGAVVNPSGFAARLRFLAGPASQNHTSYAASLPGLVLLLRDSAAKFTDFYPLAFAPIMVVGVVVAAGRGSAARRIAALLPLFFALSFTLAFNGVARRSDHRFLLPQTLLFGVYAGLAIDSAAARAKKWLAPLLYPLLAALFGAAVFGCLAVDAALLNDPRYDAESWLRAHALPGDLVETYGNNVYLPHFPKELRVTRVGLEAPENRNPMPDIEEVESDYEDVAQRRPAWIVVPEAWVWRYIIDTSGAESGRVVSGQLAVWQKEIAAGQFFRELHREGAGYRLAHVSRWQSSFWPPVNIHSSTGREVRIFRRVAENPN